MAIRTDRKRDRGQAMVEFALVAILAVIVLFVSIQYALIGQLYLALGQMNYRGVRYAAINADCVDAKTPCGGPNNGGTTTSVTDYMLASASPTIVELYNQGNSNLKVTLACSPNPCASRAQGDTVSLTAKLTITGMLFLSSNGGFFGLLFPSSLSSTQQAFTESAAAS
jgi:Flp pilus assembly protein TadG